MITAPPSEILDRLPPQSLEAERGVIGSLLLAPALCDDVAAIIKPDDFYGDANRRIYGHITAMHDAGSKVDRTLLVERLKKAGEFEMVGGIAYLIEIIDSVAVPAHAEYYARIIRDKATLRAVIHVSTEALRDAYDYASDPNDLLDNVERKLAAIANGKRSVTTKSALEVAHEAMELFEAIRQRKSGGGLATGLLEFDTEIGGLFPGELIVLSARSSVGKTALALQIANHNAMKQRLTYFASLEMGAVQLAQRAMCALGRVNGKKIRNGKLEQDEFDRLVQAACEFGNGAMELDERPKLTVGEIRRTARWLMRKNLKLVVVDYLQIVTPDNTRDSRERQVASISEGLKSLARELQLPVLVLAQLNRKAEQGKAFDLSFLRESDAVGQNADVVLGIDRGAIGTADEKKAVLTVGKNRQGPVGKFDLTWEPEHTRFICGDVQPYQEFSGYAESYSTHDPDHGDPF